MDRQTRLVWLGTSVAVAVVWTVGLTLGKPAPTVPAASAVVTRGGGFDATAAGTAAPAHAATPEPPGGTAQPEPALSPTPAAPAHPKSPGQVLPRAFLSETPDPYWAKDAEATIRAAFADAKVPEGSLLSVECRRRICRAEIWFDSKDHLSFGKAYATLRERFGIDVGFERISAGIRGEPEQVAAYFPRKGYALRDFESPGR